MIQSGFYIIFCWKELDALSNWTLEILNLILEFDRSTQSRYLRNRKSMSSTDNEMISYLTW